jgi:hypothetical protein
MLHRRRRWFVTEVESGEELAEKLTEMTWTGCQAFRVRGSPYLFANDSTSPDGAQEYTILMPSGTRLKQIESITFSWCTPEKALRYVRQILAGRYDGYDYGEVEAERFLGQDAHGTCHLCA